MRVEMMERGVTHVVAFDYLEDAEGDGSPTRSGRRGQLIAAVVDGNGFTNCEGVGFQIVDGHCAVLGLDGSGGVVGWRS